MQIVDNEIYDQANTGIFGPTYGTVIESNDIHGNKIGIVASFTAAANQPPLVIKKNKVRDNRDQGLTINSGAAALVTENEIYGHSGVGDTGLIAQGGAQVTKNFIYDNTTGVGAHSSSTGVITTLTENRIYGNSLVGVSADGFANVDGNLIYSNSVGLQGITNFSGIVARNVIYSNSNRGILLQNSNITSPAQIINNTVYQTVGEAIRWKTRRATTRCSTTSSRYRRGWACL